MYNFILKNKLTILLAVLIILTIIVYNVTEKFTLVDPTEQINESLDNDAAGNVFIDNSIITGKLELPEVHYSDPNVSDLYMNFVDEKNDKAFHKYTDGAVVFDQLHTKC